MSVRQYIGARYVPRFSEVNNGIWSNIYSYEPLIIVKNGNDYYTSKKSVPVGIAITNTEYWAKTGDYNGAISALDTRLTAAEADIVELAKYDEMIVIGDSWMAPSEGGNIVMPKLSNILNIPAARIHNYAIGGTGFLRAYSQKFIDQLTASLSDTSVDKDKVKYVICFGGTNDRDAGYNTAADYIGAIDDIQTIVKNNYHNAQLYVFFMQGATDVIYPYYLIRTVQAGSGANVINAAWFLSFNDFANRLHPTNAGYLEVARFIGCNIMGSKFKVKPQKSTFTDALNAAYATDNKITALDTNIAATWDEDVLNLYCFFYVSGDNTKTNVPFGDVTIPSLGIPILVRATGNPLAFSVLEAGLDPMKFRLDSNTKLVVNCQSFHYHGNLTYNGECSFVRT